MYPDEPRDPAFGEPSAMGIFQPTRPLRIGSLTASELIIGGAARLFGWSLWETTGTAVARIRLWSRGTTGELIGIVQLNQSESRSDYFFPHGIAFHSLYKEGVVGSVDGVFYILPE